MRSIKGKRQIRKGMYWAESMMPDPIALSPLGCAHQRRMRTYEVRPHILSVIMIDTQANGPMHPFLICSEHRLLIAP